MNHKKNANKKRDYYQVLQIKRDASIDEIKKAYKKLAMKWHPDKNPNDPQTAKQKFRQISEAYQILADPQKRNNYNLFGGPKMQGFGSGMFSFSHANDIFENFFKHSTFDNQADEDFFSTFLGKKNKNRNNINNNHFGSLFDNDFFNNHHDFNFSGEQSELKGTGYGLQKTVNTTTKNVNGKKITTQKTTIFNIDGSKQITQQTIQDNNTTQKKTYCIAPKQIQSNPQIKPVKHT